MCCCEKPNINGEFGYKWNLPSGPAGIHSPNPPDIPEGYTLLYDEPGRCGGIDAHSYHYRVVKVHGFIELLVRHGDGDERVKLCFWKQQIEIFAPLDSDSRFWILNAIYHAHREGARDAESKECQIWMQAAADKRIKTRRLPKQGKIKVWIEPLKVEGLNHAHPQD